MSVVLCRVDDRLIHGQVVVGWGQALKLQRIVLADDEVARSDWEQDLYRMAVPAGLEVVFATVAAAASRLAEWERDARRTAVLMGSIEAAAQLYRADPAVARRINLGGIHHRPGRTERLPYVYLTDEEQRQLERLAGEGAQITGQDVPTSAPVPLEALG
ncbi:MAG TPA: PTS sugar transporter subunit IIB [Gemmatimonadales bacterium]|nr:PTS sugar transporter subunit IIB [Gemmatimonadales bacterium]